MSFVLNKSVVTDLQAMDKEAKSAPVSGKNVGIVSIFISSIYAIFIYYRGAERNGRIWHDS